MIFCYVERFLVVCRFNLQYDTQMVSILYRTHKSLSSKSKVASLYAFDALCRAARHQAVKQGLTADSGSGKGNSYTFLLKVEGVLDGLIDDMVTCDTPEAKVSSLPRSHFAHYRIGTLSNWTSTRRTLVSSIQLALLKLSDALVCLYLACNGSGACSACTRYLSLTDRVTFRAKCTNQRRTARVRSRLISNFVQSADPVMTLGHATNLPVSFGLQHIGT